MISLLGHGCRHLFLAQILDSRRCGPCFRDMTPISRAFAFILLAPVWYAFMRDKSGARKLPFALQLFTTRCKFFLCPLGFSSLTCSLPSSSDLRYVGYQPAEQKTRFYAYETWLVDV